MQYSQAELAAASDLPARGAREDRVALAVQRFRVVIRAIQSHSHSVIRQSGLSQAQLWLLWEVFGQPGLRVSELSQRLSIKPATASNLLDKVESKGLIRRERAGPDQRVVQIYITAPGAELLSQAPRPAQGALVDALGRLDDCHLGQLNDGLAALLELLPRQHADAALQPLPPVDP
jgi:DNA-binding MarR family transcriptional regulator